MSKQQRDKSPEAEHLGWLATSSLPAKKRKLIEGADVTPAHADAPCSCHVARPLAAADHAHHEAGVRVAYDSSDTECVGPTGCMRQGMRYMGRLAYLLACPALAC